MNHISLSQSAVNALIKRSIFGFSSTQQGQQNKEFSVREKNEEKRKKNTRPNICHKKAIAQQGELSPGTWKTQLQVFAPYTMKQMKNQITGLYSNWTIHNLLKIINNTQ